MNTIRTCEYHSPCGTLLLGEYDGKLCLCDWTAGRHHDRTLRLISHRLSAAAQPMRTSFLDHAAAELDEYFLRRRQRFELPLLMVGTDFQKRVWQSLHSIPFAATTTYGEQACAVCAPRAVRAVAAAIGANPISIIVPCHRVVGSDKSLTGYAGGLAAKRFLLALEKSYVA